ncbi:riboflavin synthase subunit alpha [Frigidibacter oleivorans]|uniref:riboflavin synthase subunit alpha n=1 Tax=Frigidibacter oleivorans TaxID=2487129 RepID=UPI000F8D3403|nr:riboflavin synthase subunit alpha [Frigidibacter oleivorans]
MFTGIVQATVPVISVTRHPGHIALVLDLPAPLLDDLKIGASVAVEGVCLTVTGIDGSRIGFDAMTATLDRTNLGRLQAGGRANVERSAKPTDENGGHVVSGHISCTAELVAVQTGGADAFLRFRVPEDWARYIFPRGFLAVNGASLTVAEAEGNEFTIYLIPETLRQTTFPDYAAGDRVNIEVEQQTRITVDVLERTLERVLPRLLQAGRG